MKEPAYIKAAAALILRAEAIEKAKRPGYTLGSTNVLANFESAATAANITPEQAWVVFAKKQWDAICALMTQPGLHQAEPPVERFADLLNYLKLGFAMWEWRHAVVAPETAAAQLLGDTKRMELLRQTFEQSFDRR